MLEIIGQIILIVYGIAIVLITLYCLMQFHLLYYYGRYKKGVKQNLLNQPDNSGEMPMVTVQLPIFNELHVSARLLESITQLDYPKDRFEIHVLDDSTDETVELVAEEVKKYKAQGFQIEHVTRKIRTGYKAGALKDAMDQAKGEFIAIFDADFLPKPSFLRETIKQFNHPKVGVVQTRWTHLNQDYSLLTRVQAFQLNVHFTVEQLGRKAGNLLLQFNGTAGVWRKECINDAGGWEADTLTEDLDLSYRAQLREWEIKYLEDTTSPAELPAEINGLKSQQYRWMKGGAETAKKLIPTIWRSQLSPVKKLHATTHLLGSSVFIAVFILGFISVPLAFVLTPLGIATEKFAIFLVSLLSILIVYYVANVEVAWHKENKFKMIFKFVCIFPIFLSLSMGLSFHNSLAVIQVYLGKKTAFVRTPKFDITKVGDGFIQKKYFSRKIKASAIVEGLLFFYFMVGFGYGIWTGVHAFAPMHFLLMIGYGLLFYYTLKSVSISRG